MSGLRERKRHKTLTAIHDEAMRLFAERGYNAVTVADIADAADVGRATVFAYYGAKEEIILGEAPDAVAGLRALLDGIETQAAVIAAVRDWLRPLVGWIEPDLLLQLRLADEVPAVGAARSRLMRSVEDAIADALTRSTDGQGTLAARLVAGSLAAALRTAELEAAQRIESTGDALTGAEIDALLDHAVAFVEGGLDRIERGGADSA